MSKINAIEVIGERGAAVCAAWANSPLGARFAIMEGVNFPISPLGVLDFIPEGLSIETPPQFAVGKGRAAQ